MDGIADQRSFASRCSYLARRVFSIPSLQLPLRISERRLLLLGLDLGSMNGALVLVLGLEFQLDFDWGTIGVERLLWGLFVSALWVPISYAFDAYDLHNSAQLSTAVPTVLKACVTTTVVFVLTAQLTSAAELSRLALAVLFVFELVLLIFGRTLYVHALSQPFFHRRALILGAGRSGWTALQTILENAVDAYQVVGFVDDDPTKQGRSLGVGGWGTELSSIAPFKVLGDRYTLRALVVRHRVTTVILCISHDISGELLQILMDCVELGVSIVPFTALYEELTGRVPVEQVGDHWNVAMPVEHAGGGALWPLCKRLLDITLAVAGLCILAVITPIIALAIRLDSPGPIFYTQLRVGKGGRLFRIYKFRSMVQNAENGRAEWAQDNDRRITRIGHLLRRSHVDEFLQFINILQGEMSVVGPRPERPEFVEELAREIPWYRVRHAAKPGTAGWALIKCGYAASRDDALMKLQYDLYYIKHQSLWLDLVIILKTIMYIATLRGR